MPEWLVHEQDASKRPLDDTEAFRCPLCHQNFASATAALLYNCLDDSVVAVNAIGNTPDDTILKKQRQQEACIDNSIVSLKDAGNLAWKIALQAATTCSNMPTKENNVHLIEAKPVKQKPKEMNKQNLALHGHESSDQIETNCSLRSAVNPDMLDVIAGVNFKLPLTCSECFASIDTESCDVMSLCVDGRVYCAARWGA